MAEKQFRDPALAALARDLGLRYPAGKPDWQAQARQLLGEPLHQELENQRAALRSAPHTEEAFYEFVAARPAVLAAMLEGRLGYYDAVLPAVAEVVQGLPHARIADLGSYSGFVSLYLGARFPDARVVGIERNAAAVERAREYQKRAPRGNVEFIHGDYTRDGIPACDVVLSLQTIPTYLLPYIASADPESYRRGPNLAAAAADPSVPGQPVKQALAAAARLATPGGRVLLHERLPSVATASYFFFLASQVGLRRLEMRLLGWETANEREGMQVAPLLIAAVQPGPAPFDEAAVIDLLLPRPAPRDLTTLPPGQGLVITGREAEATFAAYAQAGSDIRVRVQTRDRQRFHIHLGVAGGRWAYVYTCNTADKREFKVCDSRMALPLFQPVVDYLVMSHRSGDATYIDPSPEALAGQIAARFGM